MKRFLRLLVLLGAMVNGRAQPPEPVCSAKDREIFGQLMEELDLLPAGSMGEAMIATGMQFLDTPYEASTLELGTQEALVVNLRALDCTTFVENVLAISRMKFEGHRDWDAYLQNLAQIRYRDGEIQGYPSRLHYFTDWIRDNQEKGLVKDITPEIGGVSIVKEINFMGTHPELYPALGQEDQLERIRNIEASLSSKVLFVLPAEEVAGREGSLRDGDIIALATSIQGLDVTHTGIAVTGTDGRVHLLHASTGGTVVISKEPLPEYLKKIKGNTGIIVARPLGPGG